MTSDYDISFWQIMETVEVNHSRVLKDLQNPLEIFGPEEFQARYRFTKDGAIALFDIIKNDSFLHSIAQALPAMHQILMALRYYATGHFQTTDGDLMGVHQNNSTHIKMRSEKKSCIYWGCASRKITRTRRVTSIYDITRPSPSIYDVKI